MKESILQIIEHYGVLPQLKYFQSEIFELNEAIIRYEQANEGIYNYDFDKLRNHIAEELADVQVMLEQFKLYYGITSEEITNIFCSKVNRQLDRISKDNK